MISPGVFGKCSKHVRGGMLVVLQGVAIGHPIVCHIARVHVCVTRRATRDLRKRSTFGPSEGLGDISLLSHRATDTADTNCITRRSTTNINCRRQSTSKLRTCELSQRFLQREQLLLGHVKLVLSDSIWPTTAGEETKLSRLLVCTELAYAVVGPRSCSVFRVFEFDGDGSSSEMQETRATVVSHHGLSTGLELCVGREGRGKGERREGGEGEGGQGGGEEGGGEGREEDMEHVTIISKHYTSRHDAYRHRLQHSRCCRLRKGNACGRFTV